MLLFFAVRLLLFYRDGLDQARVHGKSRTDLRMPRGLVQLLKTSCRDVRFSHRQFIQETSPGLRHPDTVSIGSPMKTEKGQESRETPTLESQLSQPDH